MSIQEALHLSLKTLKGVMVEKINETNVQVMVQTSEKLFRMYTLQEVHTIIESYGL